MLELIGHALTTQQLAFQLGTSPDVVRYAVSALQLLGILDVESVITGPTPDIAWTLSTHALHHREQNLACRACALREKFLWGGPVLE